MYSTHSVVCKKLIQTSIDKGCMIINLSSIYNKQHSQRLKQYKNRVCIQELGAKIEGDDIQKHLLTWS